MTRICKSDLISFKGILDSGLLINDSNDSYATISAIDGLISNQDLLQGPEWVPVRASYENAKEALRRRAFSSMNINFNLINGVDILLNYLGDKYDILDDSELENNIQLKEECKKNIDSLENSIYEKVFDRYEEIDGKKVAINRDKYNEREKQEIRQSIIGLKNLLIEMEEQIEKLRGLSSQFSAALSAIETADNELAKLKAAQENFVPSAKVSFTP